MSLKLAGSTFQRLQHESFWIGRSSVLRDQSMETARKACPIDYPCTRAAAVRIARDYNRQIVRMLRHLRHLQDIRDGKR